MEKIYLSGPISEVEMTAKENFKRAEKNLTSKGFEVINPFNIVPNQESWMSDKQYWFECMVACLPHLKGVKKICKVYQNELSRFSYGTEIENLFAEKLEIEEIFEVFHENEFKYIINEGKQTRFL